MEILLISAADALSLYQRIIDYFSAKEVGISPKNIVGLAIDGVRGLERIVL